MDENKKQTLTRILLVVGIIGLPILLLIKNKGENNTEEIENGTTGTVEKTGTNSGGPRRKNRSSGSSNRGVGGRRKSKRVSKNKASKK